MKLLPKATMMLLLSVAGSMYAAPSVQAPVSAADVDGRVKAGRTQVQLDLRHVLFLQTQARKEKDVIKLNCVNDKLVQLKPQANIVDQYVANLEVATDESRATLLAEFNVAVEGVRKIREEADRCIGEGVLSSESENGWTGPDVPDNPFTDPFSPPVEPPGYASPFN